LAEDAQSTPSTAGSQLNPLFGATLAYQVFEWTSLGLAANRSISSSLFETQLTEITSVTATIGQRLFGRLQLGLTAGYRTTDYLSDSTATSPLPQETGARSDEITFASISLGAAIRRKGNATVSYQRSANKSNVPGFTYNSDQYTFSLGYRF